MAADEALLGCCGGGEASRAVVAAAPRNGGGGRSTRVQTLGNIVVSIVGTGVLGLPFAFRAAGWLAGAVGVACAGSATVYCMLLLVECSNKLKEEEELEPLFPHYTYGDLGAKAFGPTGRFLTECLVIVSQAGGSVAYLIFIGQNLSSVFSSENHMLAPYTFIFAILLPLEVIISFIRTLSSLAPVSIFADACNVLAMALVLREDIKHFDYPFKDKPAFNGLWGLPFASGVAVFCFEGFSMTLALEASMAERKKFGWVLSQAFIGITVAYACFGMFGYLAYGDETKDIITLNLPNNWWTAVVKVGLCVALAFTFPIMMHPIHEIIEAKLISGQSRKKLSQHTPHSGQAAVHLCRISVVVITTVIASLVPAFGSFISLVGSTVCTLLSFVLPALFHLSLMRDSLCSWRRAVDWGFIVVGVAFAAHGTYTAFTGH